MPIQFTVPGEPIGKPRMTRSDKWKRRDCVLRYRAWADAARLAAGQLPDPSRIRELRLTAYFRPPASWSQRKQQAAIGARHRTTPDCDNCAKAVLDALFENDSAVADLVARKRYDWQPRVDVTIETEGEADGGAMPLHPG